MKEVVVDSATKIERSPATSGDYEQRYEIGAPGLALASWLIRQGLDPHRDLVGRWDPAERRWFFCQGEDEDG